MSILIVCQCGKHLKAQANLVGRRVKCPKCGVILTVPDERSNSSQASKSSDSTAGRSVTFDVADSTLQDSPPSPDNSTLLSRIGSSVEIFAAVFLFGLIPGVAFGLAIAIALHRFQIPYGIEAMALTFFVFTVLPLVEVVSNGKKFTTFAGWIMDQKMMGPKPESIKHYLPAKISFLFVKIGAPLGLLLGIAFTIYMYNSGEIKRGNSPGDDAINVIFIPLGSAFILGIIGLVLGFYCGIILGLFRRTPPAAPGPGKPEEFFPPTV